MKKVVFLWCGQMKNYQRFKVEDDVQKRPKVKEEIDNKCML